MIFPDSVFDAVNQLPVFQEQLVSGEDLRLRRPELRLHALLQVEQIPPTVLERDVEAFDFTFDLVRRDDAPRGRQFTYAEQDRAALRITRRDRFALNDMHEPCNPFTDKSLNAPSLQHEFTRNERRKRVKGVRRRRECRNHANVARWCLEDR
jgi:hypothetical protein